MAERREERRGRAGDGGVLKAGKDSQTWLRGRYLDARHSLAKFSALMNGPGIRMWLLLLVTLSRRGEYFCDKLGIKKKRDADECHWQ